VAARLVNDARYGGPSLKDRILYDDILYDDILYDDILYDKGKPAAPAGRTSPG
jgi:hypothetical protein